MPSLSNPPLPLETKVGTQFVHTQPTHSDCAACPYLAACFRDVMLGNFAWCERLLPIDLQ